LVLIENEGVRVLLYRVVSQVHEKVVQVAVLQTFLEDKDSERVDTIDQGVNAQVEFETVYEVGLV
jgi:hypothetical protein